MKKTLFNDSWLFARQSCEFLSTPTEPYREITLPYDAMLHEKRDLSLPGGRNTGYYPSGSYEYKKKFFFAPEWEGRKVQLLFEGIYAQSKVYVNHMYAGSCLNGYIPFVVDLDPYLTEGENEITVVCTCYRDSRWYSGAGIYRNVWLLTSDTVYLPYGESSIAIKDISGGYATLEANVHLKNDSSRTRSEILTMLIHDAQNREVLRAERRITLFPGEERNCRQRLTVKDPELWSLETPSLYRFTAQLSDTIEKTAVQDSDQFTFGIRRLTLSKTKGLELNGEPVKLRGTCIHHDNGILGSCAYADSAYRKLRLLKEAGVNAVRISHHPAGQEILDACDRLGMLVMNEAADAWSVCKNPYDQALFFDHDWENVVRSLVQTSQNHPSVALYSLGNEIIECGNPKGAQIAWKLNEKIKELDPDRFTILCLNVLLCMMDMRPEPGSETAGSGEQSKDVNEAMTKGQHVFKSLITSSQVAAKVEEALGYADIVGYNYGDSRYLLDKAEYPERILCGSETFSEDLAANWELVKSNPQIIGDFNWTGWDYIGETGLGMVEYLDETSSPDSAEASLYRLAYCGDFDLIGNRRAQSYYRQTVWGQSSQPWIMVQHPEHFGKKQEHSPWSFFDGLPIWDYPGKEGCTATVQVYADADEVELFLNETSFGKKTAGRAVGFVTEFTVPYEAGELCAIAFREGKETSRHTLVSGTGKSHLLLQKEESPETEDHLLHFRILNQYENGVPDIHTPIAVRISVENGELLGLGSADPKGNDLYYQNECTLFQGNALAVVRGDSRTKVTVMRKEN